ncbi:MAG: GNAT family N-acetyltransferase, partial [Patescibacteria group bacterium]|nr:GNAT family N-acetyltransferase [Patescibacteria group bacterium]
MNIRAIAASELSGPQWAAWSCIQRANAALESPFFRPEFTRLMAAVHGGVEVAVLEEDGAPVGFMPFHRSCCRAAYPVGLQLSGFHGVIAPTDLAWHPLHILKACDLSGWRFDHQIVDQTALRPYQCVLNPSPWVDLSGGFDAYRANRRAAQSTEICRVMQKARKIERELGPLRLEPACTDREVLAKLIAWKRQQCRHTGVSDIFVLPWPASLLERALDERSSDFSAMMSVLYAGDRVAAVLFGFRSGHVLHGVFPAFDVELSKYSPGLVLWVEMFKAAESLGIRRLD